MSAASWLLLAIAAPWLAWRLKLALLIRRIPALESVAPDPPAAAPLPSVTILAAARDEGEALVLAVRSWLAQDHPRLQVVAVDDRSSDLSFAGLVALAEEDARLLLLRVESRPPDWLGKCHALQQGLARATGDFVLLTDGDVTLAPWTLRRAVAWCEERSVDHLAVLPRMDCESLLQAGLTATFFQVFLAATAGLGPLNRDHAAQAVGVGAFGLVRRSALDAVGGFRDIRLQVGDDVALARLLVRAGARHRLLRGLGSARVRWQRGLRGALAGLEKNAFWGVRLSIPALVAVTCLWLLPLLPLAGLAMGNAVALAAAALACAGMALPHLAFPGPVPLRVALAVLHPVAVLLLTFALWNSAVRTLARGGVSWRGDFVPLADLRAALKPLSWWRGRDRAPAAASWRALAGPPPTVTRRR